MKKFDLQNFSLKGILNVILMKKETRIKLQIFNKTVHHGYVGLFFLADGITFNIPYLNLVGISLLVHDIFAHIIGSLKH